MTPFKKMDEVARKLAGEKKLVVPQIIRVPLKKIAKVLKSLKFWLLLFTIHLSLFTVCYALEKDYQAEWCNAHNGVMEYRLDDGARVDCLTEDYAVEVDYAHKWAEAIGQSLFYALSTGKKAGILLIVDEHSGPYIKRLRVVANDMRIKVWMVKK